MDLNSTINGVTSITGKVISDSQNPSFLVKIANILTFISQHLTLWLASVLGVSARWVSLLLAVVFFGLLYLVAKVSRPALKWIFRILLFLLILGMFMPSW